MSERLRAKAFLAALGMVAAAFAAGCGSSDTGPAASGVGDSTGAATGSASGTASGATSGGGTTSGSGTSGSASSADAGADATVAVATDAGEKDGAPILHDASSPDGASVRDSGADTGSSPDAASVLTPLCATECATEVKVTACAPILADCESGCLESVDETENPAVSCESKYVAMVQCDAKLTAKQWECSSINVVPIPVLTSDGGTPGGTCAAAICAWSCCVGSDFADPDLWVDCMPTCAL